MNSRIRWQSKERDGVTNCILELPTSFICTNVYPVRMFSRSDNYRS